MSNPFERVKRVQDVLQCLYDDTWTKELVFEVTTSPYGVWCVSTPVWCARWVPRDVELRVEVGRVRTGPYHTAPGVFFYRNVEKVGEFIENIGEFVADGDLPADIADIVRKVHFQLATPDADVLSAVYRGEPLGRPS